MRTYPEWILTVEGLKEIEKKLPLFQFPESYLEVVEQGVVDIGNWFLLSDDLVKGRHFDMKRYNKWKLVPFAGRYDCDDVACFDTRHGQRVFIVHDGADPDRLLRGEFETFTDWYNSAMEEPVEDE